MSAGAGRWWFGTPACNQVLIPQSADDLDVPAWLLLALGDVELDLLPFLRVDAAPPRHRVRGPRLPDRFG
jgi:hypothetical protein